MTGSYVAGRVRRPEFTPFIQDIITETDLHITVLYSSAIVDERLLITELNKVSLPLKLRVSKIDIFDCWIDGVKDESRGTVVMVVDSRELHKLHNAMLDIGGKPSTYTYQPHVSLSYEVPLELTKINVARLKRYFIHNGIELEVTGFYHEFLKDK